MDIHIVTIFPDYFAAIHQSLLGKAVSRSTVSISVHDLRQWSTDKHKKVDDSPYGGSPGMVMQAQPWANAIDDLSSDMNALPTVIIPTPSGEVFTHQMALDCARLPGLIFTCGRYEGIDSRFADYAAARLPVREISIGDYVLAGGEAATLVMIEAITRFVPGVMGNEQSYQDDSFFSGLLEGPVYTRPAVWNDLAVPEILLSGHHENIDLWRRQQALIRTAKRRPDLLRQALDSGDVVCSPGDMRILNEVGFVV